MKKILCLLLITILLFLNVSFISTSRSLRENMSLLINNSQDDGEDDNRVINLKKGDIVFRYVDEELYPLFSHFMHPMLYTGKIVEQDGHPCYEFVEAHGGKGACYSYYPKQRILDKNDPALFYWVYRVKNADEQNIKNAVDFAEWRCNLGDPFLEILKQIKNYNPKENNSWYCTEFIWAAYFNCKSFNISDLPEERRYGRGIDIDENGGFVVLPKDIQNSEETEARYLFITQTGIDQNLKIGKTWIVDDEGDGDFVEIQTAIDNDALNDGDLIQVYSGEYNSVIVKDQKKEITLEGISHELGDGDDLDKPLLLGCFSLEYTENYCIRGFNMKYGLAMISCDDIEIYDNYIARLRTGLSFNNDDYGGDHSDININ